MISTNPKQGLSESVTRLIVAYQQAMQQSDKSDFVTKAEVTRTVIDSGRAIANRLRTREQGTDELVQKLEHYYQSLHAEDWVAKSTSAGRKAAAIMGLTSAVMVALVLNTASALFEGSVLLGFGFVRYVLLYPASFFYLFQALISAYKNYSSAGYNPSTVNIILSSTVDPAEQQVYALIGGSRPARTFERINQVGAIAVGVIVFVFACGFVWGILQGL